MDLELPCADRGLDPVSVSPGVRERLRYGGLGSAEETKDVTPARRRTFEHAPHGLGLDGTRPEPA